MAKTIFHTITEIEKKKKSPPLEVFFMLNKPKLFFKLCIHAGEKKKKKNLYNLLVSFIVVSSLNCLPEMDQSSGNYTLK